MAETTVAKRLNRFIYHIEKKADFPRNSHLLTQRIASFASYAGTPFDAWGTGSGQQLADPPDLARDVLHLFLRHGPLRPGKLAQGLLLLAQRAVPEEKVQDIARQVRWIDQLLA